MKYNYYAMKKGSRPLPEDINKPVEVALNDLFKCPELVAELVESRIKRRFSTVDYSFNGIACQVQFVNGIIPRYFLIGRKKTAQGEYIVQTRSVNNDALIYDNNTLKNE